VSRRQLCRSWLLMMFLCLQGKFVCPTTTETLIVQLACRCLPRYDTFGRPRCFARKILRFRGPAFRRRWMGCQDSSTLSIQRFTRLIWLDPRFTWEDQCWRVLLAALRGSMASKESPTLDPKACTRTQCTADSILRHVNGMMGCSPTSAQDC